MLPVLGHISLSWRNLSKRKVQRRMSRSILLSRHFVVKPVETLFQSTNVFPTIECSTSQTLAARASLKLLSTRFEKNHSYSLICIYEGLHQSIILCAKPKCCFRYVANVFLGFKEQDKMKTNACIINFSKKDGSQKNMKWSKKG